MEILGENFDTDRFKDLLAGVKGRESWRNAFSFFNFEEQDFEDADLVGAAGFLNAYDPVVANDRSKNWGLAPLYLNNLSSRYAAIVYLLENEEYWKDVDKELSSHLARTVFERASAFVYEKVQNSSGHIDVADLISKNVWASVCDVLETS